jgi:hypothetical protein
MSLAAWRFWWNWSEGVFMAGALRAISFMDEVKLKAKFHPGSAKLGCTCQRFKRLG